MAEQDFKFRQVTLCKDQVLGQGAYGVVYKAECDGGLICAAKYLHPTFFVSHDPGTKTIAQQFKRECNLLSRLKHPNIVQYLGTHEEDGLQTVVLLMELLDCSLHSYLDDHQSNPLPFHQEINICLDVSRALDYLHANNIHHRDLSCKNILMLGEFRAKVSDFGMSKLRDPKSNYSSNTPCPGNVLYMPPEALKVPPDLTDTLDEFSFGVVMIQILSRCEPQPTALHLDKGDMQLAILPEIQRRKRDIDLCDPANPILQLAISCISNNPQERPLTEKLCQLLSMLKTTSMYKKSSKSPLYEQKTENETASYDFIIVEHSEEDRYYTSKIETLENWIKDKDEQLKERDRHLSLSNQQLVQKQKIIEDYQSEIREKEMEILQKDQILLANADQLTIKEVKIIDQDQELIKMKDLLNVKETDILNKDQQLREKEEQLARKEAIICTQRDRQVSLDENYSKCLSQIESLKEELASKDKVIEEMQNDPSIYSLPTNIPRFSTTTLSSDSPLTASPPIPKRPKVLGLKWRKGRQAPVLFQPQSSTIVSCKERVYISICNYVRNEGKIYEYNVKLDTWNLLPVVKKSEFSLAAIDDSYVVAIGGCHNLQKSGTVLRLFPPIFNKWVKAFTDVPTPRSFPMCAYTKGYLLVAGGEVHGEPVFNVEVLDVEHETWLYVRHLLSPLKRMTVCTMNNFVYFVGGFEEGALSAAVYTVNTKRLVGETRKKDERLWIDLPSLPVSGSSCVSVRNRLLAVGGFDTKSRTSSNCVYEFNQISGTWLCTGYLPRSLSRGLASVVTVGETQVLVVIGGNAGDGTCSQLTDIAIL